MKLLILNLYTLFLICSGISLNVNAEELYAFEKAQLKQVLGKKLFFDNNLSSPEGMACSSCHLPTAGFADPDSEIAVSRGIFPQRFGSRNTPTVAYATFSPAFHFDKDEGVYVGGQFLDGRVSELKTQAMIVLLDPLEMANRDAAEIVTKVEKSDYQYLMRQIYGEDIFTDIDKAFDAITVSIAAFLSSTSMNPFNSKYDQYLAGKVQLTSQEKRGLELFEAEDKGNCAACHPNRPSKSGGHPLFTDFTYDNLGIPKNPDNPFLNMPDKFNPEGKAFVDLGLGKVLHDPEQNGKFKVMTLRNIELTAPYGHNGFFKTLREIVDFYNTRDVSQKWAEPEVKENMNTEELGNLKLTEQEVDDIVVFLRTLTDGYQIEQLPESDPEN